MENNFFEHLTGMSEWCYRNSASRPRLKLSIKPRHHPFLFYGTPPNFEPNPAVGGMSFETVVCDVRAVQLDPKNNGDTVQVASNFHSLEQMDAHTSPEDTYLSDYTNDLTQGPFAVLQAPADLIFRRYLLPFQGPFSHDALDRGEWLLDMLCKLRGDPYRVKLTWGGWADLGDSPLKTSGLSPEQVADVSRNTASAVVMEAQITHDAAGRMVNPEGDQRVNQVLCSTLDCNLHDSPSWSLAFLIAAYINTLEVAMMSKSKKVFLTLIGGGVFGNPVSLIATAIAVAINTLADKLREHPVAMLLVLRTRHLESLLHPLSRFASGKIGFVKCIEIYGHSPLLGITTHRPNPASN
jgi:hypothetical protein